MSGSRGLPSELLAPAKLNLGLYVGRPRAADGLHEIRSLFIPLSLADRLRVRERAEGEAGGAPGGDEVVCEAVPGPDLTARALAALRAAGWGAPPLRIEVDKRIPIAAGLGGGSADAAAVLRLAAAGLGSDAGIDFAELARIAAGLGADVPSQLAPRFALVGGAGERVEALPEPEPFGVVLLPDPEGLSTADVYAAADRLGSTRGAEELARLGEELRAAAGGGASPLDYRELLVNDLAPAALELRPSIGAALEALAGAGAELALVTGSGPTAVGLFRDPEAAGEAAGRLRAAGRRPIAARSGIIAG